ncbi:MAG: nuclear transport factor 2 family protein [Crocinitomicaceae bacterium]
MKLFSVITISFALLSMQSDSKKPTLDALMDGWHLAASNADYEYYFGLMNASFVFLGTAGEERWDKKQFSEFSKPYFDKGKAWSFTAKNRRWKFSRNKKVAWFDEDLDTWMRACRGSGVMVKRKGKWKLAYYNLTVLIENEKMKEFIELRDKQI